MEPSNKGLEIPEYHIKSQYLGEIHASTTERYIEKFMKGKGIESVALELRENRLIGHVETVVANMEE